MKILVTGTAGFIGSSVADRLLADGYSVVGVDSLDRGDGSRLQEARLARLTARKGFTEVRMDLADSEGVIGLFEHVRPQFAVHLAARTGVRISLEDPDAFVNSNLVGFSNILTACRRMTVKHLVFASSSSVYGSNKLFLFSEHHSTDHPLSFYAATKKANEAMAHAYSYAYGLPVTGLRFFSVYGPWGRPDMAPFIFTEAILHGKTIQLFNRGEMQRDFTYIDDVTEVVARVLLRVPKSDHGWHSFHATSSSIATPYRLLNVGNGQSVSIAQLVLIIEEIVGRKAKVVMAPMQKGDLPYTCANIEELLRVVDFAPSTPLAAGIARFVAWYRNFHH